MLKRIFLTGLFILLLFPAKAQEARFFSDGTDPAYYDQGIVDVANLGGSFFEHTCPPGFPQYNDKVPCSTTAFRGTSSLKFNYISASGGNWKAGIFRSGWTTADIEGMDSISFYAYSATEVPSAALPLIGLRAMNKSGSSEVSSALYRLSDYNGSIPPGKWIRITFPLSAFTSDIANSDLNFSAVKAVLFSQSETNNTARTILLDEITVFKRMQVIPEVTGFEAGGYDSHAELSWRPPVSNLNYRIYGSSDGGNTFELRGETTDTTYLDFVPSVWKNRILTYRVVTTAQGRESLPSEDTASIHDFSDEELLNMVQKYTFRYFWEGAHQGTGMALERTDGDNQTVASGATGMGLMAMIIAHERGYQQADEIKERILMILSSLETFDRYHGAWSHWYYANTGRTRPFSTNDNGGDLVETSYVAQGLIAVRNYFSGPDARSVQIREKANLLWETIDWAWYRQNGQNVLYWHWSPDYNFQINMKVTGWNECMVTYLMAASSPARGIPKEVYTQGWAGNGDFLNYRVYYNYGINLSPDWGGPLFWIHYSHLGINPHGLKDQYVSYWKEHVNTVKIHHAYAVENPFRWEGYSDKCWGLTAGDDPDGYSAHQPWTNDNGTISPTAALGSLPYAPDESMMALKYFYRERGRELFGRYGFYDAFNDYMNWVKKAYIGIDQGPIIIMIENYRTSLLWDNVMKDPDIQTGLNKLGFQYRITSVESIPVKPESVAVYPNPVKDKVYLDLSGFRSPVYIRIFTIDGRRISDMKLTDSGSLYSVDCSVLSDGLYIIHLTDHMKTGQAKLLIQK